MSYFPQLLCAMSICQFLPMISWHKYVYTQCLCTILYISGCWCLLVIDEHSLNNGIDIPLLYPSL